MDSLKVEAKKLLSLLSRGYSKREIVSEERLKKALKDIEKNKGSTYNRDLIDSFEDIAKNYQDGGYPNITINEKALKLSKGDNFLMKIIMQVYYWLANLKPEELDKKGTIRLVENGIQIIPIQCQKGHIGVAIVNKDRKTGKYHIVFREPNGNLLQNVDKFKDVKTKEELLSKIFRPNDVKKLMQNGCELYDSYHYSGFNDKQDVAKSIFGNNISNSSFLMNTDQHSKDGACGIYSIKFVSEMISKIANAEGKAINYKNVMTNINNNLGALKSKDLMQIKLVSAVENAKNVLNINNSSAIFGNNTKTNGGYKSI